MNSHDIFPAPDAGPSDTLPLKIRTAPEPLPHLEWREWSALLDGDATPAPYLTIQAMQGGGPVRYASTLYAAPAGHQFKAAVGELEEALGGAGYLAVPLARIPFEPSIQASIYMNREGTAFTTLRSDRTDPHAVHWVSFNGVGDANLDRWCEALARFYVKEPARRERRIRSTDVHVLTGTALQGYGLSECGVETSRFIPDNYAPETVAALRTAGKALVHPEPPGRLLLLEGPPGTGKTRALRAMIRNFDDKVRVIIVPPHLMADLSGPNLIGALLRVGRAVLVIEDADYALLDREKRSEADLQGSTSALSAILNLSDGILGAHIDLRIVATTNQRIGNLDAAVLRPGRLLDRISFGELSSEQASQVVRRELRREINLGLLPPTVGEGLGACTLAEAYAYAREQKKGLPRGRRKNTAPTP